MEVETDPGDGLPRTIVGPWIEEKHRLLRAYVDICRGVRSRFSSRSETAYIEPYCGYGRSRIRETDRVLPGSAIVAGTAASDSGAPYSRIFVADVESAAVESCHSRLGAAELDCIPLCGRSEETVPEICDRVNSYGLHFAFLDPYNLGALPFSVIERLASLKRVDIMVHISAMDLNRNLRRYVEENTAALEAFAPGWRDHVNTRQRDETIKQELLSYWHLLLESLEMQSSRLQLITGTGNQPLYWLALLARNDLAQRFWREARKSSIPQRDLFP